MKTNWMLSAAVLSAVVAHAAEEPVDLGTMQVTAARATESTFSIPQPVTVVTGEEISERSPQVMTEAFRYEPGAFFQQTGPGQGIVITRGLKGAEVLHLVDGMRLNNAFFRTAPSQYIALVDAQNIGQLELLRGPYATVYGSDAIGGVVQVLTPEYRFKDDSAAAEFGGRVHYASDDLARTGRVYGAAGNKSISVAGGVSFAEYGQRKLPNPGESPNGTGGTFLEERVNGTDYLSRGYDFKTIWTPGGAHELTFSVQYFDLPVLPRYNELVAGFGPLQTPAQPLPATALSIYDNNRAFYHLRYRHTAPLAFMDSFEIHAAQQIVNDDRIDRTQTNSRDTFEFNRSTLSGLTAQAQTRVSPTYNLLYGIEVYDDRIKSRSRRETPPGSGTLTFNTAAGFQSRFPDGADAQSYGAYAVNEWNLTDRWLLDLGGRTTYQRTVLPVGDRPVGAVLTDSDITGSLGSRFALTPTLAWTANLGRGYRSPNINDLAQVGSRSANRFVLANYALKPESVLSVDTGLKWLAGGWQTEATVFYSEYKDRITLVNGVANEGAGDCPVDADADGTPNEANVCAQNRNISEALYYGFEGGARYVFSPQLTVHGVLNYTFGQQEANGVKDEGNRVPPLNGQIGVIVAPVPAFTVEPYVYFADQQNRLDSTDLADKRMDPRGTPGYAVANLRFGWEPAKEYRLQLEGTNLLDKNYREHGSGIEGGARGVALTAEARFK